MTEVDPVSPSLKPVPLFAHESLYVGIDIGKKKHVAGFLSHTLLQRYQRFEACPALMFDQSREGFRALAERMQSYTPLEQVYVLLEHTGHYHLALEQYLHELDLAVYIVHVQKRPKSMLKTDKRDALSLANTLYSQLELGAQVANKLQLVRRTLPPTEAAKQLRGLIRHRYELMQESTQRKNKLTSLCDQLFPELTQVFKNPNLPNSPGASRALSHSTNPRHGSPERPSRSERQESLLLRCETAGTAATGEPEHWSERCHSSAKPHL